MNARQLASFAQHAAKSRAASWPAKITREGETAEIACAKSATRLQRRAAEMGVGWVQEAVATFLFQASGSYIPDIGNTFTLVSAAQGVVVAAGVATAEAGTRWRVRELDRSTGGAEHRCICFRLDD